MLLSKHLQKVGCDAHQAAGDADVLIVLTAVQSAISAKPF